MRIYRGKVHDYLGMYLYYLLPREISVRIEKYMSDTIEDLPENITALVVIPAADNLFNVSTMATRLKELKGRAFHRATAKLLFLCKILIPDIHLLVEFLTTRVK